MEDSKFDRIIASKLEEADSLQYRESVWNKLQSKLPRSGLAFNWTTLTLVSLLLGTNAWWVLNLDSEGIQPPSQLSLRTQEEPPGKPSVERRTMIVYDTIYHTVTREEVVNFRTENPQNDQYQRNEFSNGNLEDNKGEQVIGIEALSVDETEQIEEQGPATGDPGLTVRMVETDSLKSNENRKKPLAEKDPESPKEREKERHPYEGPRWLAGAGFHKPLIAGEGQKEYRGWGIGGEVEFILLKWISIGAELSTWNQEYVIEDQRFFEEVRNLSDPSLYTDGGVYGSGYTWEGTQVSRRDLQGGVTLNVMPYTGETSFRPYISLAYLQNFNTSPEVTNRLSENGTGKIVRVESSMPGSTKMGYLRTEAGIERFLNEYLGARIAAGYWKKLGGSPYEEDLAGVKVMIFTRIK